MIKCCGTTFIATAIGLYIMFVTSSLYDGGAEIARPDNAAPD